MQIFESQEEDLSAVLDLQYLAYRSEAELYNDFTIPPLTQTLHELQAEVSSGICLVAKEKDQIVGSVRAIATNGICKIGKLIVRPSMQGKGVGTSLMQKIESMFPEANEFEVFTGHKSTPNIRLYKRLGYSEREEKKINEKVSLLFLAKPKT